MNDVEVQRKLNPLAKKHIRFSYAFSFRGRGSARRGGYRLADPKPWGGAVRPTRSR